MQPISSLLKDIQHKKNEIQSMADIISEVSGVLIAERDIIFSLAKGFKKIRLNTSGSKKTLLVLKRESIQEKLAHFGVTLVL